MWEEETAYLSAGELLGADGFLHTYAAVDPEPPKKRQRYRGVDDAEKIKRCLSCPYDDCTRSQTACSWRDKGVVDREPDKDPPIGYDKYKMAEAMDHYTNLAALMQELGVSRYKAKELKKWWREHDELPKAKTERKDVAGRDRRKPAVPAPTTWADPRSSGREDRVQPEPVCSVGGREISTPVGGPAEPCGVVPLHGGQSTPRPEPKMKKRKKNPRTRPATQADVKKAKSEATTEAMRRVLYLMLYVLIDKHDAPVEDIQQLAGEVNYCADSIAKGYVSWRDIERVVVDEYGVKIPW